MQLLLLLEDSMFAVWFANSPDLQLAANPLFLCDTVIADGFDTCLLVPQTAAADRWAKRPVMGPRVSVRLNSLFSSMLRVAPDNWAYDLFDFALWYEGALGLRRWLEAPPVAEVQDEREIALAGMLTRSAPPPAAASGAARGGGGPASGGRGRR